MSRATDRAREQPYMRRAANTATVVCALIVCGCSSDTVPREDSANAASEATPSKRQFDSSQMAHLYRAAKTLHLGSSEADVLRMLGRPTQVAYTDPSSFLTAETIRVIRAAGGTPDTTPFRILTWTSAKDPDNCFVMVCIKNGHVSSADCNEGKGNHTFHLD